jgi:hypothetical protein
MDGMAASCDAQVQENKDSQQLPLAENGHHQLPADDRLRGPG